MSESIDFTIENSRMIPLSSPFIRHSTAVEVAPTGVSTNASRFRSLNGFSKCRAMSICSGVSPVMVMSPLPALRLPSQAYAAPTPESGPL